MKAPKLMLKTFGPLVCQIRGHREVELVGYAPHRVTTLTGCTRCLRGTATDRQVGQYPMPRPGR